MSDERSACKISTAKPVAKRQLGRWNDITKMDFKQIRYGMKQRGSEYGPVVWPGDAVMNVRVP
jgi:hypothetical protein